MLKAAAQRVQDALDRVGLGHLVIEVPDSTRSAAEAAAVVGCSVGQIAKSLVFRGKTSDRAILAILSGEHRLDEKKLATAIGEKVERPDADFVRARTGYAIGGVPPVGHAEPLLTLIDSGLLAHTEIWAAAGTPNALFKLSPQDLPRLTGGQVVELRI